MRAHRQFQLDHNVGDLDTVELVDLDVEGGGGYLRRTSSIPTPNPPPPSLHSVPTMLHPPSPPPPQHLPTPRCLRITALWGWVATHVLRPGILAMVAAALLFSANTALARLITRSTTSSTSSSFSSFAGMCNVTDDNYTTFFNTTTSTSTASNCTSLLTVGTSTSKAAPYSPFQVLYLRALVITVGCSIVLFRSGALPILMRARPTDTVAPVRRSSVQVIVALSPLAGSSSPFPLDKNNHLEDRFEGGFRRVILVYRSHISWALLRGLFGTVAMACSYYAVSTLPSLAEAVVLYGFNPVFSSIAARIILKEHLTIFRLLGILLFMCGVVVSVNPQKTFGGISSGGSTTEEWIARGVALIGSFFNGVAIVAAKRMVPTPALPPSDVSPQVNPNQQLVPSSASDDTAASTEMHQGMMCEGADDTNPTDPGNYTLHWVAQAWWQGFVGLALAPLACFVFTFSSIKAGSELDVLVLVAQGLCAFAGQCCVGFAVERENAAIIGVLWNFDVVFAILWQSTLLGASVSWYDGVGVVFVFLGSIVCVLEKAWMDRQKVVLNASQNPSTSPPPAPPLDHLSYSIEYNESKSMRSDTQPPSSRCGNPLCG